MDIPTQRIKRLATAHWSEYRSDRFRMWGKGKIKRRIAQSALIRSQKMRLLDKKTELKQGKTERSYAHPTPSRKDHHSKVSKKGRSCVVPSNEVSHVVRMNGELDILTQSTEVNQLC